MLWLDYKAFDPVTSFPSWGYPSLIWYHQKALASWKSSLCICSSDALWSRVTGLRPPERILLPGVQFCLYTSEMPRPSLSPVLNRFLVDSAGGTFEQAGGGSGRLCTSSAYKSPDSPPGLQTLGSWDWPWPVFQYCMPLLCSPWSSPGEGGLSGRRAPTTLRAQAGAPRPSPEAQRATLPSLGSRLWQALAVLARVGSAGPGAVPPRASAAVARGARCWAPLPRTPTLPGTLSAELCSALPRHGRPASAVDARPRV